MAPNFKHNPQALVDLIVDTLHDPPDLVKRSIQFAKNLQGFCLFFETMADKEKIELSLLDYFADIHRDLNPKEAFMLIRSLKDRIPVSSVSVAGDIPQCIAGLLEGKCLLIVPNVAEMVLVDMSNPSHRTVSEPKAESTIHGPQEAFTEQINVNLSLLRKRIKTPGLCVQSIQIGSNTQTKVMWLYMESLAPRHLVEEFRSRLQAIQTDSILDSSYVLEWIEDQTITPFSTIQSTERPDIVASHLLEGGVTVLVDGSPFALIGPITFFQFFISPEDYYVRPIYSTLLRWIRFFSFILAVLVPPLFISVVSFHQELLPNPLLINISAQRDGVPFPVFVETIMMITVFEVLREAGLRMPRIAGQAISIVGALVLGEAAVLAGLVTPIVVIVVAITAISNFVAPSYSFGIAQRLLLFIYMCLAGVMGLYGLFCGAVFTIVHLASLKSFGIPYLAPIAPIFPADWNDVLMRTSRPKMNTYPAMYHTKRKRR